MLIKYIKILFVTIVIYSLVCKIKCIILIKTNLLYIKQIHNRGDPMLIQYNKILYLTIVIYILIHKIKCYSEYQNKYVVTQLESLYVY